METAMWMIYSLFILSADANDRHVIESTTFNSSEKCVQFTRTNIDFLSKGLIKRLNNQYGEKKWKPLEIGCVEVGGNPNERIVLNKTANIKNIIAKDINAVFFISAKFSLL